MNTPMIRCLDDKPHSVTLHKAYNSSLKSYRVTKKTVFTICLAIH